MDKQTLERIKAARKAAQTRTRGKGRKLNRQEIDALVLDMAAMFGLLDKEAE